MVAHLARASAPRCSSRAADLLDERNDELVPLVQAETGATMRVTKTMQVPTAAARFRRYAKGIEHELDDPACRPRSCPPPRWRPGGIIGGVARRAPVGVVACITSYNFPIDQHGRQDRPGAGHGQHRRRQAGAAGPARHRRSWARCSTRPASRPASSTSSWARAPEPAEALVASPHVDMVSFTGSTGVGPAHRRGRRPRHEAAAARARRQGRRASCSTTPTSRPPSPASPRCGRFHSGQICTAPTRVLAQRGIYDQLVERPRRRPPGT